MHEIFARTLIDFFNNFSEIITSTASLSHFSGENLKLRKNLFGGKILSDSLKIHKKKYRKIRKIAKIKKLMKKNERKIITKHY